MADNVVVTPGTGATIAADEVTDATLGTVKVQYVKLMDGTLDGTTKAAVGATGLSTNIAGLAGTAPDTNSGNKSAGTLRVVIATDQPALSNKLLVTPDLPSGASTAAKQPALGTAGTASSDVITVQGIASMTPLLQDLTKVGGNSISTGNGTAGTGCPRVTIASDNTAFSVNSLQQATTSGGATPYKLVSAATTNATSVKASAGQVYMIMASNTNASPRYLKLYNKASAPTVGTDTPVHTFLIPGNASGAGCAIPVPDCGLAFGTGIAFALTTGATDADTGAVAANEIIVNLGYK